MHTCTGKNTPGRLLARMFARSGAWSLEIRPARGGSVCAVCCLCQGCLLSCCAIESVTGYQTLLFRAPYDTDASPSSPEQLAPLHTTAQLGYIAVGADFDSDDYDRPGSDRIVQNVLDGLHWSGSNIVVFHDAGGDRRQTVDALAVLIPRLKAQGHEFVTVDQLPGVPREAVMPALGCARAAVLLSPIHVLHHVSGAVGRDQRPPARLEQAGAEGIHPSTRRCPCPSGRRVGRCCRRGHWRCTKLRC